MKKTAVLISVSGFSWLLVIFYCIFAAFPSPSGEFLQLVFLIYLPVCFGYYLSRRLLYAEPTVLKILLVNMLLFLLFTGLTVWGCYFLQFFRFVPFYWLSGRTEVIFFSLCQLSFWFFGTSISIWLKGEEPNIPQSGIIAISVAGVPAFLMLGSFGYPAVNLLLVIAIWYFTLSFTLATRRAGLHRYDIILFHSIMPCLIAVLLFAGIFSEEFKLFFRGVQDILKAIKSFLSYLAHLLDRGLPNYKQDPEELTNSYKKLNIPKIRVTHTGGLRILMYIIIAAVCIVILWRLVGFLKKRLAPAKHPLPNTKFSMAAALRQGLGIIALFLMVLPRLIFRVFLLLFKGILMLKSPVAALVKNLLPAKTPDQAILRIYFKFLRWGGATRVHRTASETPLEYTARMENYFAGSPFPAAEVRQLTLYFVETRYRNKAADWATVAECKSLFKMIKSARY